MNSMNFPIYQMTSGWFTPKKLQPLLRMTHDMAASRESNVVNEAYMKNSGGSYAMSGGTMWSWPRQ